MSSPISGSNLNGDEAAAGMVVGEEIERGSSGNGRWPREETLALIKIRFDMDANFREATLKAPLWDEVSRKLAQQGYTRSSKKCKEKFENVSKYYRRTKDGRGGAGRRDGKSYRFFAQLEALYNKSGCVVRKTPDPQADTSSPGVWMSDRISSSSESSSESESEPEREGMDQKGLVCKKRRRGNSREESRKTMAFLKSLVKQLLGRQEIMHGQFMESIEKREEDRMIREEAWKRQEMSRLSREHQAMVQERAMTASRDAALISFLEKITGQNINLPQPAVLIPAVIAVPPPPQQNQHYHPHLAAAEVNEDHEKRTVNGNGNGGMDTVSSSRWPKTEIHALIKLRTVMECRYVDGGTKGLLWEDIAAGMRQMGYNRSAKRCKEKWENINKYFKKVKESNKKRPEDAKTCPYFHQLDALYRNKAPSAPPPPPSPQPQEHRSDIIGDKDEAQEEQKMKYNIGDPTAVPVTGSFLAMVQ